MRLYVRLLQRLCEKSSYKTVTSEVTIPWEVAWRIDERQLLQRERLNPNRRSAARSYLKNQETNRRMSCVLV